MGTTYALLISTTEIFLRFLILDDYSNFFVTPDGSQESILKWLNRLSPSKSAAGIKNTNLQKLEAGTGRWFLHLHEVECWLSGRPRDENSTVDRMLWCTGKRMMTIDSS